MLGRLAAAIAASGLIGVIVMTAFPTAPPRFVGFTDVVAQSPWAVIAHPDAMMNPFGAMPSFHVAWSLLAAAAIVQTAPSTRLRAAAATQPVLMSIAVVATANHWVLDVVAGTLLAALAWFALDPIIVRLVDHARARDAAFGTRMSVRPHTPRGATFNSAQQRDDRVQRLRQRTRAPYARSERRTPATYVKETP